MTAEQLAWLAELRVWAILVDGDEQVNGLEPSAVRSQAHQRVQHLERCLANVPVTEQQHALNPDVLPDDVRNRAFGEAALAMGATLRMIDAAVSDKA